MTYLFLYRNKKFYFAPSNGRQTHLDLAINSGFDQINSTETFNKAVIAGSGPFTVNVFVSSDTDQRIQDDEAASETTDVVVTEALLLYDATLAHQGSASSTLTVVTGVFAGPDLSGDGLTD